MAVYIKTFDLIVNSILDLKSTYLILANTNPRSKSISTSQILTNLYFYGYYKNCGIHFSLITCYLSWLGILQPLDQISLLDQTEIKPILEFYSKSHIIVISLNFGWVTSGRFYRPVLLVPALGLSNFGVKITFIWFKYILLKKKTIENRQSL